MHGFTHLCQLGNELSQMVYHPHKALQVLYILGRGNLIWLVSLLGQHVFPVRQYRCLGISQSLEKLAFLNVEGNPSLL